MEIKLMWQLSVVLVGMRLILCQDIKEPKLFNGKPLIPQRVVQHRGDFSRPSRKFHPTNRQGLATKEVEEFESSRATEEKREPKNEEEEYDAILKSLLQASDDSTADKRTTESGRNTSVPMEDKPDVLKKNESISDKTVMRELLSSVKEKIGSELLSAGIANKSEQMDAVATSYRLKGIRSLVTPDLIYALAAASEGELILLAANNFPATEFSTLKNSARRSKVVGPAVIRAGGLRIQTLLREIMKLIKISSKHTKPITLCKPGKGEPDPTVWEEYKSIIERADGRSYEFEKLEHEKFVEVGRAASIVVLTGEDAEHSSILLTKGRVQGPKLATDESAKTASVASTSKPAETSTMSVPSKMEGVSAEQSRVTAKKRSGREDEEDDDETTVDDLREALEALRNEN